MKIKILLIFCLMVFASFGLVSSLSMSMMGDSHHASCPFSRVAQGDCDPFNPNTTIVHHWSMMRIFSYVILDFFKVFSIIVFMYIILLYFLKVFWHDNRFLANNFQNNFWIHQDAITRQLKKIQHWLSLQRIRDPYVLKRAHEVFVL